MKVETKPVTFELQQLLVPPGQRVQLTGISWEMFETILEVLGENRAARLTYYKGTLEIRMPLPKHESSKEIIGDLLKALLEELDREFLTLGSTTFKNKNMLSGVEPDQCFYIQNELAMRGKTEIDLNQDPPPDLAIEVDITSKTGLEAYEGLGVPELWIYDGIRLRIHRLQEGKYIQSNISNTFPEFPIAGIIYQSVEQSKTLGRSATIRAFRAWVREQLQQKRSV